MKIALFSLIGILAVLQSPLSAGTLAFPKSEPCFNVTLPEGWLTQTEEDGSIKFVANDKTPLVTVIRRVKAHTDEELKTFMPNAAQALAKSFKDTKVGEVTEAGSPNGMKRFELKITGTEDGESLVIMLSGFSPRPGTYFIASTSTSAKVFGAHEKEYRQLVNAISPIR